MFGFVPPSGDAIVPGRASSEVEAEIDRESQDWRFVDSGTSALIVGLLDAALYAAGPRNIENANVVLPAYCCPSVLSAVRYLGAAPLLVDFEPGSSFIDLAALGNTVNSSTIAVIAVNFCGIHERIQDIQAVITGTNARLIYDCCQWFPARALGSVPSDYLAFSFGRAKPVSVLHGGALVSKAPVSESILGDSNRNGQRGLIQHFKYRTMLTSYGLARKPTLFALLNRLGLAGATRYRNAGQPLPMAHDARQILSANIAEFRRRRRIDCAALGAELTRGNSALRCLPSGQSAGAFEDQYRWRLPLLAASRPIRDEMIRRFRAAGIGASELYGSVLPNIALTRLDRRPESFPAAQNFAECLITIPTHSEMNTALLKSLRRVVDTFGKDGSG